MENEKIKNNEEFLFINKYIVTKNKFMEWGKENAFNKKHIPFVAYWFTFSVACMIFGIITKVWISILLGLFCIYRACIRWIVLANTQYRILSKQRGGVNWIRKIIFNQDGIKVIDSTVSIEYRYEEIIEIKENDSYIKLVANNGTVIRLYTDENNEFNWEECKKRILEKKLSDIK